MTFQCSTKEGEEAEAEEEERSSQLKETKQWEPFAAAPLFILSGSKPQVDSLELKNAEEEKVWKMVSGHAKGKY